MKVSTKLKMVWSALMLFVFNMALYAQEKKVDVDINVGKESGGGSESQWYTNPVYWVIGGAVFVLILVALLRGRSKN